MGGCGACCCCARPISAGPAPCTSTCSYPPTSPCHLFCLTFAPPAPPSAGLEFDDLSPPQQAEAVGGLAVFARVEPTHKTRLVELLKAQVGPVLYCWPVLQACTAGLYCAAVLLRCGQEPACCACAPAVAAPHHTTTQTHHTTPIHRVPPMCACPACLRALCACLPCLPACLPAGPGCGDDRGRRERRPRAAPRRHRRLHGVGHRGGQARVRHGGWAGRRAGWLLTLRGWGCGRPGGLCWG
jgi:hypothetical protein